MQAVNKPIDVIIYHNPECGTSRNTLGLIRNAGIEPHVIEAVLNHHSNRSGVAGVYNRATYSRQMRAALSQWDDHVRTLVQGGKRKIVSFAQPAKETA